MNAARLKNLREKIRAQWQARKPREQRLILAAGLVVLVAGIAQLLTAADDARVKLSRELPQLRAELARMNMQRDEWSRLAALPPASLPAEGAALEAAARASAQALSLPLTLRLSGKRQISAEGQAAFDDWLSFTARLHAEQRLRLARCEIKRLAAPGMVSIHAEFSGDE